MGQTPFVTYVEMWVKLLSTCYAYMEELELSIKHMKEFSIKFKIKKIQGFS